MPFRLHRVAALVAASVVAGFAAPPPADAESTPWAPVGSGTASLLNGVSVVSDTDLWVSGPNATLRHTTDGGVTWTSVQTGVSAANGFNSVRFLDASTGWVGGSKAVLRTADGGASWKGLPSQPSTPYRNALFAVSAVLAWAAGGSSSANTLFRETAQADGSVVEEAFSLPATSSTLVAVVFTSTREGWAVGNGGRILKVTEADQATPTLTPVASGTASSLSAIAFGPGGRGCAVGSQGTITRTTDGGTTWATVPSGTTADLGDVVFVDAHNGWAFGNAGTVLRTADGGATWTPEASGTTSRLRAAAFSSSAVWAVGDGGVLLRRSLSDLASRPRVLALQPDGGPTAGGTPLLVTGSGFAAGATVRFGGVSATDVVVLGPNALWAKTAPRAAGTVDVTVEVPGEGTGTGTGLYTYLPDGLGATARSLVPVVLSSSGAAGSFYTSELTLTNRGGTAATVTFRYTAAFGGGGGTAIDFLLPGEQKIVPDAIAYLRSLGVPIPDSGNRGGTLHVTFTGLSSPAAASVTVRTATAVPEGRAGLAYAAVPGTAALTGTSFLCGLRQNASDRSNVAVVHGGDSGDVTLRLTAVSGDPQTPGSRVLEEVTLAPGGFRQLSAVLEGAGYASGFVQVDRIAGTAPYFAYGVVNDQNNSDGSFVPPLAAGSLRSRTGLVLPVAVETNAFATELVLTNVSGTARSVRFTFVADAVGTVDHAAAFSLTIAPREQRIVPDLVSWMRSRGIAGIGAAGPAFAGALFATVDDGDADGLFLGGRTSSAGGGGRYGLFYVATPSGEALTSAALVSGLRQDAENRTNLALVNTGESDGSTDTFRIDLYDGRTGGRAGTREGVSLAPRAWTQIGTIPAQDAPGVTQGFARVTRTSGENPFLAYSVVNDGGRPGERTGDGAFVPAEAACDYAVTPLERTVASAGESSSVTVTTLPACPWSLLSGDESWLAVPAGSSSGSGPATFTAAANAGSTARAALLNVAGKLVSVNQPGTAGPGAFDGTWTGTTGAGRAISFSIVGDQLTRLAASLRAQVAQCVADGTFSGVVSPPVAISGNSLVAVVNLEGTAGIVTVDFRAVFSSASQASGTLRPGAVISGGLLCVGNGTSLSWAATRP